MRSVSNRDTDLSISHGFSVLPWGHNANASNSSKIEGTPRELLEECLNRWPESLLIKGEISNLSGSRIDSSGSSNLLSIAYSHLDKETETSSSVNDFTIRTKFARFEGSREIIFSLDRLSTDSINNPRELLLSNEIRITDFELNVSLYQRRWASLFGFFPVPTQMLSLSCSEGNFNWNIEVQRQSSRQEAESCCHELLANWVPGSIA